LELAIQGALGDDGEERRESARRYSENWSMTTLMNEYDALYELARQRFDGPVA
jgi:hypothetical protein